MRWLVAVLAAVMLFAPEAEALTRGDGLTACSQRYGAAAFEPVAAQAWREQKWRDAKPVGPGLRLKVLAMRSCPASKRASRRMTKAWRTFKRRFAVYRAYRLAAPFEGFRGEGKWLRWLAIPSYIVACETNGYSGAGRFTARNASSGAGGTYQILPSTWVLYGGSGLPDRAPPWRQTEVAAAIWADSGPGAWACS